MEKEQGKVKAISTKRQGFYSFILDKDDNTWYSGKGSPNFNKGDEVEFEFVVTQNGQYTNRNITNLKVLSAQSDKGTTSNEVRINVDAGNMVSFAKDIVVASQSNGQNISNLKQMIKDMTLACTEAFLESKKLLEGNKVAPKVQHEEPPIEYQDMSYY